MKIKKRGQEIFGMSYGAIFSIIVIVLIISVAFFAIRHFLSLSKCTQIGLFYDELADEVEKAWTPGSRYQDVFNASLPTKGLFRADIQYVCFGPLDPSASANPRDEEIRDELSLFYDPTEEYNVFIYPSEEACGGDLAAYTLKCRNGRSDCFTTNNQFFCANASSGSIGITLRKDATEALVKACSPGTTTC